MFDKVMMFDSTISTCNQKYPFYKLYGNKKDLLSLAAYKKSDNGTVNFASDNYLIPDIPREINKYNVS